MSETSANVVLPITDSFSVIPYRPKYWAMSSCGATSNSTLRPAVQIPAKPNAPAPPKVSRYNAGDLPPVRMAPTKPTSRHQPEPQILATGEFGPITTH